MTDEQIREIQKRAEAALPLTSPSNADVIAICSELLRVREAMRGVMDHPVSGTIFMKCRAALQENGGGK